MRLNAPLVTSFVFEGEEYDIDLAFNTVLDVFDILEDKTYRNYEKAQINIAILLGVKLTREKAVNLWNYIYETFIYIEKKEPIQYDLKGNPMPTNDGDEEENFIDIKQDAEYLYASFMQAYQIDLYESQGKMHWRKFQSLLNGLPDDTIMQKVIRIRRWKPSKGEPSKQVQEMERLQRIYALEKEEVDE